MPDRSTLAGPEIISGRSFSPPDLRVAERLPGISAFLRIRNGADFLEATIESHLPHFDEIVAVYNLCTDATPDILLRLRQKHGPKLRVLHYVDRVFPPGSEGHARTGPASPASFVNYTNVALAETRHRIVAKIDDDHLAIPTAMAQLVARLRAEPASNILECFSGPNLMRDAKTGMLGVCNSVRISGLGDVGFFHVNPETYFTHDRRFEMFRTVNLKRRFAGFVYWHLKYLKAGNGFENYELRDNPQSRYHKQRARFQASEVISMADLRQKLKADRFRLALLAPFSERHAIRLGQVDALLAGAPMEDEAAAEARLEAFRS
ncbi:MAG: glycosyltransferase [Devosia sp.]|uniref:glycosyltransferase n=1 Tax=Devosia sp. TaxID=1871048 RepID=UPI00262F3D4D|nr:glycosyltransferase family 2 protein [Devosia sp.]MDB5540639.1 glycosyltransferase [Devosia sp.]